MVVPAPPATQTTNTPALAVRNLSVFFGKNARAQNRLARHPRPGRHRHHRSERLRQIHFFRALNRMHELVPEARMEGEIRLFGDDIYAPGIEPVIVRRRVGMVFQKSNPFPTMSIAKTSPSACGLNGVRDRKMLAGRTEESLRMAALWDEVKDRLNAPAISLSGGQQQRLCIARALAVQPEVLLMDEPASALDPLATSKIEDLILELKKDYTIVIVTHNMQQAARMSDFTAFLYLGELVEFDVTRKDFHQPGEETNRGLCDRPVWLMFQSRLQLMVVVAQ
jgi:phosphate transport system ATP-binding protein